MKQRNFLILWSPKRIGSSVDEMKVVSAFAYKGNLAELKTRLYNRCALGEDVGFPNSVFDLLDTKWIDKGTLQIVESKGSVW